MSKTNNPSFRVDQLFNVKDWVVVVSGGGTGIGLMCAQAFANNGARVYIIGRRMEALEQAVEVHGKHIENGGKLIPIQGDVSKKETIADIVRQISSKEQYVNVLVNNAGIAGSRQDVVKGDTSAQELSKQLWEVDESMWHDVYRTNVMAYYYMAAAFLPLLAEATTRFHGHSACIVNNASMSGVTRLSQAKFQYNVSKAGTVQLSTMLAQEFRRVGVKVRVNAFSPGVFPSEMTTGKSGPDQKSHISAEGFREKKAVPAGRPGKDEDIAQAVLMLAVDTYVNGQNLCIDGGFLLEHP
jgi:NAD(P)-dependent dehydrogenase (short-subunit alcohol dehydrogenase family)